MMLLMMPKSRFLRTPLLNKINSSIQTDIIGADLENDQEAFKETPEILNQSSSKITVKIPKLKVQTEHNEDCKVHNKEQTKRSAIILENEDSILNDTLKIESIRPVTSIKFSPNKQPIANPKLKRNAWSRQK